MYVCTNAMQRRFSTFITFVLLMVACSTAKAQLYNHGETIFIDSSAMISIVGDVHTNRDIQGSGRLVFVGTAPQRLDANRHQLPCIDIRNPHHVFLASPANINTALLLRSGKLFLGQHDLQLMPDAIITGSSADRYLVTNGAGQLHRYFNETTSGLVYPVGTERAYLPAFLSTVNDQKKQAAVGIRVEETDKLARDAQSTHYLKAVWYYQSSGLSEQVPIYLQTQYDPFDFLVDNQAQLQPYTHDGKQWRYTDGYYDVTAHKLNARVSTKKGMITAIAPASRMPAIQLYPNPIATKALLTFYAAKAGPIRMVVQDALGKQVMQYRYMSLIGENRFVFNGQSLQSGHYTLRLIAENKQQAIAFIKE
ncbi:MAG: T9SS type A sorting domain-containing protein [Ferruginibacter sp.]